MKNWKKYLFFIFILAVIVAVVLYYHYRHKPSAAMPYVPAPVVVSFAYAKQQHWPQVVSATGTVTAIRGVIIRAQVAGEIQEKLVISGQHVQANQPLYQIDPQGLAQLILQNKAELKLKQQQLHEQNQLFKKGYVSRDDYDRAEEAFQVALNTLNQNERKLMLTQVRAPFSGQLGVTLVNQGDYVNVNDELVSLQDPDHLRVDFTVSGQYAGQVKPGQHVEVSVAQYPHQTFSATVKAVNANVNQQNQSLLVRADLVSTHQLIVPGAFSEVRLFIDEDKPVVTVPMTALVYSDSGTYVYHVSKGVAHLVPVTTGLRMGNDVVIASGLEVGSEVVSEGKVKLMDGVRVTSNSKASD